MLHETAKKSRKTRSRPRVSVRLLWDFSKDRLQSSCWKREDCFVAPLFAMTKSAFSCHCERFRESRGNLKTSRWDFFNSPSACHFDWRSATSRPEWRNLPEYEKNILSETRCLDSAALRSTW